MRDTVSDAEAARLLRRSDAGVSPLPREMMADMAPVTLDPPRDPEKAALHAYRARVQAEVIAMRDTLDQLAGDYAERLDANTKAAPYCAGAFNAYVTARRLHDRLLLVAEESAGQAASEPPTQSAYETVGIPSPLTLEWLRSEAYDEIMRCHVTGEPGMDEAEERSPSYCYRHLGDTPSGMGAIAEALGVWRWRGMHRYRDSILPLLEASALTLDFGGAAGGLGLGSVVVDQGTPPLSAYAGQADVVFSSHTLEHVPDLDATLGEMVAALKPGGHLVLHVPAWTCVRWRAGVHRNAGHGDHMRTFDLGDGPYGSVHIERAVEKCVAVESAASAGYCGDNSIMVIARKP